jgi:hypothetical protein
VFVDPFMQMQLEEIRQVRVILDGVKVNLCHGLCSIVFKRWFASIMARPRSKEWVVRMSAFISDGITAASNRQNVGGSALESVTRYSTPPAC